MTPVSLYNTMTRRVEKLEPVIPNHVGVYCCGPTVYNYQHIGNMKTYIFEDVLVRSLRRAGYEVKHVMNITDVGHLVSDADEGEDKMAVAMKRENKKSEDIAKFYTDAFFADSQKLHVRRPDVVCAATKHIQDMIALIERIEANGFTYVADGNVYFDVSRFGQYGKLARLDLEALKAGARIEVDPNKKSPFDFVLWFTKSKFENQELQWDSPWGKGYPGWHIECSAMSMKYLGEEIDIHCGGIDHIPVHHTNEIAQSEAATGKPWVKIWMHSDFILMNREKMSKSKGGFLVLDDVIEKGYDPLSYRYFCLAGHYRSQLNFSFEALDTAQSSLKSLKNSVLALKAQAGSDFASAAIPERFTARFDDAIFNDVNTPQALACVREALADKDASPEEKLSFLYGADEVLGLGMAGWEHEKEDIPAHIQALADERQAARAAKDWARADAIRKELQENGYSIEDSSSGPKISRQKK